MEGIAFWGLAVLAAMLVGMAKGGLPLVGMLSMPLLTLVISPITAAGLLLPVYVVSDMFGLYAYRRAFDARVVAIMAAGSAVGIGVGWATASLVSEAMVTLMVGLIGFSFALSLLVRRAVPQVGREAKVLPGLFWGVVAGFTSFVSHAGAPPYQVYVLPLRLPKAVFAGTTTIVFAWINVVKIAPYAALGQLNPTNLRVAALLVPAAVLAVFIGVRLVRILPEALFFRVIAWALLVVSVKLIWDGATG
ncbi:MAG: sulfite exporter TauE/SafE family protein [Paracoccaceae bacterium]